jgi:hypothetical protein
MKVSAAAPQPPKAAPAAKMSATDPQTANTFRLFILAFLSFSFDPFPDITTHFEFVTKADSR